MLSKMFSIVDYIFLQLSLNPLKISRRTVDPVCAAGSMKRSSVCLSVRPSVCLSVCRSHRRAAAAARAAGLLLSAQLAGDCSRRRRAHPAARLSQQQRRRSTALSSKRGQCHVDNRRTRLNSDFNNINVLR